MLQLKSSNILQMMPLVKKDINDSILISFDIEMSGIAGLKLNACFEDIEDRYKNMKKICLDHSIIQLGITCFKKDEGNNKYIASTYSLNVLDTLNSIIGGGKPNINFNFKSLSFLISNGFDVNEWANNGIHFIKQSNKKKFVDSFDSILEQFCSDLNREITNDIFYILTWLRQVNFDLTSVENDLKIHELECKFRLRLKFKPTSNILSNYYFMNKIRRFLLDGTSTKNYLRDDEFLWCENHENKFFYVSLIKLFNTKSSKQTPKKIYFKYIDDRNIFQAWLDKDKNELIDSILSLSTIFDWISQSSTPVIGHNCLLDLIFVYHSFIDEIPKTFYDFKENIIMIFPKIFDTKLISHQEQILKLRYTSLTDCFVSMCLRRDNYRNIVPDIFVRCFNDTEDPKSDDYTDVLDIYRFQKINAHDAGFDSLITGFIFIYFGFVMMRQAKQFNRRKSSHKLNVDFGFFLNNTMKNYCNKLFLAKFCNQPLSLVLKNDMTSRFYPKVLLTFNSKLSVNIFHKLLKENSNIDLQQTSSCNFSIGATHFDNLELFLHRLVSGLRQQKQQMFIANYEDHKSCLGMSRLRKISWYVI